MKIKYAYELDNLLKQINKYSNCDDFSDRTLKQQLNRIRKLVLQIHPKNNMYDEIWSFWVPVSTGSFNEYLKLIAKEEGMEESELREELQYEWESDYPENKKWYRLGFALNKNLNEFSLSFDSYFLMTVKKGNLRGYASLNIQAQHQLMDFIYHQFDVVVHSIIKNAQSYAEQLEKNLPKRYRFGRIKRSDYWDMVQPKNRLDTALGKKRINQLKKILPEVKEGSILKSMTAEDFFRYCEIAYEANGYTQLDPTMSSIEKYCVMADMRCEGLTEIKQNSEAAFTDWYKNRSRWGHPWEICRGGNSTHISLFVSDQDRGWKLRLAGSSHVRVVETVKMVLALYENGIIVMLSDAEEVSRMISGLDYIGLVPYDVTPRYCGKLFPDEDDIIHFQNPWLMKPEDYQKIEPYIYWYPLDKAIPLKSK